MFENWIQEKRGLSESEKHFLSEIYLRESYIVPEDFDAFLLEITAKLEESVEGFCGLAVVGGVANGSLAFRRLERSDPATDLDFYVSGKTHECDLGKVQEILHGEARNLNITLDGFLNGTHKSNYLNLDNINLHVKNGDFNLLSLPFGCFYGDRDFAVKAISDYFSHVEPDLAQEEWGSISDYHAQGLLMQHGSWSTDLNDLIIREYYPQKVEKFGLPEDVRQLNL